MAYYSFHQYLTEKFGCKVYKLALSCADTCPNRDGTCGTRGCIFCSAGGSGEFASPAALPIEMQIENAKKKVESKCHTGRYIAYFQSYTSTYADISHLKRYFWQAILHPQVVALSIATRPDCLQKEILDLLAALNRTKPVFIELGLQTIHQKTADYIRRGYPLSCFALAMQELMKIGVQVVVHVILGLPGESREQMLKTVSYVGKSGAHGIKLQLLHILKGTDLALEYVKGRVNIMTLDEYTDLLCDCIERLPPDMVIHRLTGDGPKRLLLAPLWSADKKRVLNAIQRKFTGRQIVQGRQFLQEEKNGV